LLSQSVRFFGIDRDERLCDLCDHSELGDEFHYLCNCTFFAEERKKYLPRNLLQVRNVISFNSLMNSEDRFVLIGLAKYCNIVMSIFK
jgi:hypothetical protein